MTRRVVLAAVALAVLGGGATTALAEQPKANHKVCLMLLGNDPTKPGQEGYCIGWSDPRL